MFNVINIKTGDIVGKASTMKRAKSIREKKDLVYGGYAHTVKPA